MKAVAAMRAQFGGHAVESTDGATSTASGADSYPGS
jgi:hypothetical protein